MFTLCMSRGANKHIQDNSANTNNCGKQIKGGYLLRYKRGWLCRTWCEEWVVLYEDSTVAWFKDKGASAPCGRIRLSDAPELLAVGEWTRHVPRRPGIPADCHVGQLMALGTCVYEGPHNAYHYSYGYGMVKRSRVHWLMAQSATEVSDWMTAISNTLPPPPRLTLDRDKRCSVTLIRDHNRYTNGYSNCSSLSSRIVPPLQTVGPSTADLCNRACSQPCVTHQCPQQQQQPQQQQEQQQPQPQQQQNQVQVSNRTYEQEHTVPAGVVIDWGHGWGWGWGEAAWAAQLACGGHDAVTAAAVSQALYCASSAGSGFGVDDYSLGGYDDVVDYSACADFSF